MKIIISHDVDHLYPSDHLKDLIFPKLWLRSSLQLIQGKINLKTWYNRLTSIFGKRMNMIPELISFEESNKIKSTFFFGMESALGMSYSKKKALRWIDFVRQSNFEVGVHGINFDDINKINKEFQDFRKITNLHSFGIRMHYVRYNNLTFKHLSNTGYYFDTSEFNKHEIELKAPYQVGQMWEFPLHIMDVYILENGLQKAKELVISSLKKANEEGIPYFTILFHDYFFNIKTYPDFQGWYIWLAEYLISRKYEFVTYQEAISELENRRYYQN
jgi:hypothetical protein